MDLMFTPLEEQQGFQNVIANIAASEHEITEHTQLISELPKLCKFQKVQVRDKQIARIIGKAPTIAAAAYLRLAGRPPVLPSNTLLMLRISSICWISYLTTMKVSRASIVSDTLMHQHFVSY